VKRALPATLAVAAALFAANMLAVAVAEAPTVTPLRTISVQGVARVSIGQFDNAAAATATYREGMADAVTDAQSKADFLAGKISATVGPVQSVAEGGGYITCIGGGESNYAEYEGEEPDFGSAPASFSAPAAAVAPSKTTGVARRAKPRRVRHRRPTAKKATAVTCTLTAQVSLVYAMN
jgi:hypothetical protein